MTCNREIGRQEVLITDETQDFEQEECETEGETQSEDNDAPTSIRRLEQIDYKINCRLVYSIVSSEMFNRVGLAIASIHLVR